jgi:hypothetical protein
MLTKDLIRARLSGDTVKPQFVRTDDPEILRFSEAMILLYGEGEGTTAAELDEAVAALSATFPDKKLAGGLHKTVRDRAEFSLPADCDYPAARVDLFRGAAALLRSGNAPEALEDVRAAVFASVPDAAETFAQGIYCDLPECERLLPMRKMLVREVPERYNVSLVQSLLLFASKLIVTIPAKEDPAFLRRLFRYMKFFRLLFTAEMTGKDAIRLTFDGPASVLEHSAKYGLQIASFFPAVCQLPHWSIAAEVMWKEHPRRLKLDESSGLVSHYSNFAAYRPEEIRMFFEYFRSSQTGWTPDDMPGWIPLGGQELLFPDFVFRNEVSGRECPMELFHLWHAGQLEQRLRWCEEHPERDLLLGVDRALLKKDGVLKERLEASDYFQTHGFLFRDFPGVEKVLKLLDSLA